MIIKEANLLSALTHLREALSTLAPEEELNGEQMYIREQLEEVETLLMEANEAEEEPNDLTPSDLLDGIKSDIAEFVAVERKKVSQLLPPLDYHDSSRCSFILDYMEQMETEVKEMEITGR